MKNEDLIYDTLCRLENKLDRHIEQTSNKVGRGELIAWFTIFGGIAAAAVL